MLSCDNSSGWIEIREFMCYLNACVMCDMGESWSYSDESALPNLSL